MKTWETVRENTMFVPKHKKDKIEFAAKLAHRIENFKIDNNISDINVLSNKLKTKRKVLEGIYEGKIDTDSQLFKLLDELGLELNLGIKVEREVI